MNIVEKYDKRSLYLMFLKTVIIYTKWQNLKLDVQIK